MNSEKTSLGARLYRYRKEKGLSQEELADRLDVTRQSVSKWETDASVPELDKLLRMSDLFGVSLDCLVRGEDMCEQSQEILTTPPAITTSSASHLSARQIVGIILTSLGALILILLTALGGFFAGLMFSSPFLLCGLICLLVKKRAGLLCAWGCYFLVDLYLTYATGTSRSAVLLTHMWTKEMNYVILLVSWIWFLLLLALFVFTLVSFRHTERNLDRKTICALVLSSLTVVFSQLLSFVNGIVLQNGVEAVTEGRAVRLEVISFRFFDFLLSWVSIIGVAVFLTLSAAVIRRKRREKRQKNG